MRPFSSAAAGFLIGWVNHSFIAVTLCVFLWGLYSCAWRAGWFPDERRDFITATTVRMGTGWLYGLSLFLFYWFFRALVFCAIPAFSTYGAAKLFH